MEATLDPGILRVMIIMVLLTLPLKGVALWRAARAEQKGWYVALLIFNSFGLLELTYLFYFSKSTRSKKEAD